MDRVSTRILKIHNVSQRLMHVCARASFLSPQEYNKLVIAASEVLDNLITHGEIGTLGVIVTIRRQERSIICGIYVEAHDIFAKFAGYMESCKDDPETHKPWYDAGERRWHGLGLRMCENLADRVRYRSGKKLDRIYLEIFR